MVAQHLDCEVDPAMAQVNPIESLRIAVRVFPNLKNARRPSKREASHIELPTRRLVLDFETRVDALQAMTFGCYRYYSEDGRCVEEGLVCADDLPRRERRILQRYIQSHMASTEFPASRELVLISRSQFIKKFYLAAYKGRCRVVGFNLPFDLSRIACGSTAARGRFAGGFSLALSQYGDDPNRYRANIAVKHIDSKRALKGFTGRDAPDKTDRIPEGSTNGKPREGYIFRGHFLDLRTLIFALTDRGHSLESACRVFAVEHPKTKAQRHGGVTEAYIDYCRSDVRATAELDDKALAEYARHPIPLQATKAYSPASIGKAYLHAMNIAPILRRQEFPLRYLGYAQSAFYGGRASAHVRKMPVPVVYCDFLSMYPTVNSLMSLWEFVIAKHIRVVLDCCEQIERLLRAITLDQLFDPTIWPNLTTFVRVAPDRDVLPVRAQYSGESNDVQVAVSHLHAQSDNPKDGIWYALPDVIASVLLTGRVPKIVDAFRIVPEGVLGDLRPVKLLGSVPVDPRSGDFFRTIIEQRKIRANQSNLSQEERERYDLALKVLANATSYGIFAEMNQRESDSAVDVTCYGIDSSPYTCRVAHPEEAGEYCFPPLASLITSGARLMLAMLEHCVNDLSGTYAMEDTDSMAIIATQYGGAVSHLGVAQQGDAAKIHALSWEQVRDIAKRFEALNPYDKHIVPGSILKIEDDNFDPQSTKQRQLWCYAIAAKRYALFLINGAGEPVLLRREVNNKEDRWSEHGLGHLLNPTDPQSEDREWIAQTWLRVIRRALGLPMQRFAFENRPAISRITLSSPALIKRFADFNKGKQYPQQLKPFNFLLSAQIATLGHPPGVDPRRFHLIAPYEPDATKWLGLKWIDQYSRKRYSISTKDTRSRNSSRVKTYGDVMREYEYHPESKCADSSGKPCAKQTNGLLQRRHIRIDGFRFIGKESNRLEEVEAGLIHDPQSVYTEYPDKRRDEWTTETLPALKVIPLPQLQKTSGLSRAALQAIRAGRRPHPRNQALLRSIVNAQ